MSGMVEATAIQDAITAAQAQAAAVPLRDYGADDFTVSVCSQEAVVEIPTFDGFKDFELDLTCLRSPPSSPPESVLNLELRIPSPTASPDSRPSLSNHDMETSHSPVLSARSLSPLPTPSIRTLRGSLPLKKYIGRGTPVDRNRRILWGRPSRADKISEDGFLFYSSEARSPSLDSASRQASQRSPSPDWTLLTQSVIARRSSTLPPRSRIRPFATEPLPLIPAPAIRIDGLGEEKPEEWASFMNTVLESTAEVESPATASTSHTSSTDLPTATNIEFDLVRSLPVDSHVTLEEIGQLDADIDMNLGTEALDLGLRVGDESTWIDRETHEGASVSAGRCDSPSVYSSCVQTLPASRPASPCASVLKSMTSTKAERTDNVVQIIKSAGPPMWWRRVLRKLKKVQILFGYH